VAQLFQDLAALVQHQSEMLDSIESNVELAGDYMRKGNKNLRGAIEYQKKSRKCLCCVLCIVIVIIIALVAGLGSFFSGAFNKL
jgi:t-SNARE complex subunit (syntaxin)